MADFDPYYQWLAIPPKDQPPNHYRLLGVELFESSVDVIAHAADQRYGPRSFVPDRPYSGLSQKLLNELAAAKVCLLNAGEEDGLRPALAAAVDYAAASSLACTRPAERPSRSAQPTADCWGRRLPSTLQNVGQE